jgi:hypothetical protein
MNKANMGRGAISFAISELPDGLMTAGGLHRFRSAYPETEILYERLAVRVNGQVGLITTLAAGHLRRRAQAGVA